MPSSRPNTIPTVIHLVRQLQPRSILDVGVGFGKWGHLFREYTDILAAEHDPPRYQRANWQVRIEGIEGHAAYLTPMHQYLYDEIHVGDAAVLMKRLANYDLVFLGDIIEHFEKAAGMALLQDTFSRANKAVIVSTPKYETAQEDLCGNELERHRSLWGVEDFKQFPAAIVQTVDEATLIAVLSKPGTPALEVGPPRPPTPEGAVHQKQIREAILQLVPREQRFILVDDEQLRHLLPRGRAIPFVEKAGQYWGPPPDAPTAIYELERLRRQGATFIVFVSSCFWWLDYYAGFARHLRAEYRCVREDELLVAFDLR
jgi:hypothetical protein